ncbi:MAG: MerR family transcriptional regulator [Nitriliruptorales bacterium]|nr:MerR family transcriptional regulator [Nitriliruptorales bacterium]
MPRTVGEVAELANVTIRTLHHYDEIGLVKPSGRTDAGYRLYDRGDLERLQQVLFYRELGFALEDIKDLLDAPDFDRGRALRDQHELLMAEAGRLGQMITAVEHAIAAHEEGTTMSEEAMFEVFGEEQRQRRQEAAERWGETDAWSESRRRTADYTKEDWEEVKAESEAIMVRIAEVYTTGAPPDAEPAMDAVEAHRRQIDERFYPCSHEMQVQLGEMYVADPRFRATYEELAEGLAEWVRDAIVANANRAGTP